MKNDDSFVVKLVTVMIYATLAFLILSFVMVQVVPLLINPSNYKSDIIEMVMEKTGRTLTLEGDIKLDLFPETSITLKQVSLSNAPGFNRQPMVNIERLYGKIHLMQLFQGDFALTQVKASGVQILLERNAKGANNWDDLVAHTHISANSESGFLSHSSHFDSRTADPKISLAQLSSLGLAALAVQEITLKESEIRFCEQHNQTLRVTCQSVTELEATPGQTIMDGEPIHVQLQADVKTEQQPFAGHIALSAHYLPPDSRKQPVVWQDTKITIRGSLDMPPIKELEVQWHADITVGPQPNMLYVAQADSKLTLWSDHSLMRELELSLKGQLQANLMTGIINLPQGGMAWQVKADYLPPAGIKLDVQSAIELDWFRESLRMEQLRATGPAQIHLQGSLKGDKLFSRPTMDVELTAFHFDPRALLVAWGRPVPPTTDPKAISSAELAATIHMDDETMVVKRMALTIDDTHFSGNLSMSRGVVMEREKSVVRFDIQGDILDLQRYLPPHLTTKDQQRYVALAVVAPELFMPMLPANTLVDMDLKGSFNLQQLQVAATQAEDVLLELVIADRQLHLQPYQLAIYGGEVVSHVHWDARAKEPLLRLEKGVTGVQIEPLLQVLSKPAVSGRHGWSGALDLTLNLASQGKTLPSLQKNLSGDVEVAVHEGQFPGIDLENTIRQTYTAVMRRRPPAARAPKTERVTHFDTLTARGVVSQGVLDNQDLLIVAPTLKITGAGSVDLPNNGLDYVLQADVATSLRGMQIQNLEHLQGLQLPVRIKGNFATLKAPTVKTVDLVHMLRSARVMPVVEKVDVPSEVKGKVMRKIEKLEKKWGSRENVNQMLRKMLGIGR